MELWTKEGVLKAIEQLAYEEALGKRNKVSIFLCGIKLARIADKLGVSDHVWQHARLGVVRAAKDSPELMSKLIRRKKLHEALQAVKQQDTTVH